MLLLLLLKIVTRIVLYARVFCRFLIEILPKERRDAFIARQSWLMSDHGRLVSLNRFNERFELDLPAHFNLFKNVSGAIFIEIV